MDALLKQLTPIVDLSPDDIADFRHALKSSSRYRPVVLKNALTDVEIARFAVNQFHFNGVTINSYQDRPVSLRRGSWRMFSVTCQR
ncbi:penicillin-binding protein [Salmonella enterica subsp. enterica]|nr:penicillin-binding protein [Salmonella enterica subsp. enterica]